jgi:hypothetical protein
MKIYDEIIKGIEHSRCLSELKVVYRMLRNAEDDLTIKDYQELEQLIINKEEEWN